MDSKQASPQRRGLLLALIAGLFACNAFAADLFQDVANSKGLNHTDTTYGSSWADFDGDGRPDLWIGNHNKKAKLYRNDPVEGFVQYTDIVGLATEDMHGSSFADFDNDGDQDLLVAVGAEVGVGTGPNQFLVNDNGQFVESAVAYGIDYEFSRARHVTWLDWNNDSWLDFIIVSKNNRDSPPEAPSRIFTFDPVTNTFVQESTKIHDRNNTLFASLLFDSPALSGKPAVIMSHNITGFPDGVLEYSANGFNDQTQALNFPQLSGTRDFALADFDNDGDTDMFIVNQGDGIMLEHTSAGFTDITNSTNINFNKGLFTVAADFDNDKDIDIYIGRSDVSADVNQPNIYLRNNNNGTFSQVPDASGAEGTTTGFTSSVTAADYNNDGFVDLLTTNSDNWYLPATTGPMHLFENQGNSNNFLAITLVGTLDNRDAIGARVFVTSGGTTQLREQNGGVHHRSQNHSRLHFGLGTDSLVNTLEIHWPNGNVQSFSNVLPNQFLTIYQNDPSAGNLPPVASFESQTQPNDLTVEFDASNSYDPDGLITTFSWNFGDGTTSTEKSPVHSYELPGEYSVTLTVTDAGSVSDTASQSLSLEITTSVEAVGSVSANAGRLIDKRPNGEPDFSTHWTSDNNLADAWLTLDIGQTVSVAQVLIAPRGDRDYVMDIYVGSSLTNGKVSGAPVAVCSTEGTSPQTPTGYTVCNITPTDGRYLTVQATNRSNFRVYGIDYSEFVFANVLPLPAFSGTPGLSGLDVAFDAAGSTDADGNIASYSWNFGDGNSAQGQSITHSYAAAGSYLVDLTTTDNNGGSNTISAELNIAASSSGVLPATVQAVGSAESSAGNLLDVLGNGEQNLASNWQNNNGVLADAWFTLDLGATNTVGSIGAAPRADRLYRLDIYVGNNLDANGRVTGVPASQCEIEASSGNRIPTALTPCTLANGSSGRYLTVAASNRNKLSMYGVAVYGSTSSNSAPQAAFTHTQQPGILRVDFDASASTDSDGIVVSHLWTFGDGTAGAGATTDHIYANDTERFVTLTVTDEDGAIDTRSALLLLDPPADTPQFLSHPESLTVEEGSPATFGAVTTGPGPISYQWQVGGVDIAGAIAASYVIPATTAADDGAMFRVIATNADGSTISNGAELSVTVISSPPLASFTATPEQGFEPLVVGVDASASSAPSGTITNYSWDFGDGNTASGITASNSYSNDGSYSINLTVTDSNGATATSTQTIVVDPLDAPSIIMPPQPQTVALGEAASFSVTASGSQPLTYQWRANGTDLPGAIASSYSIGTTQAADDNTEFSVTITNSAGQVTSASALLLVSPPTSSESVKAAVAIASVGGNSAQQNRIIDPLTDGEQNLDTVWDNNSSALSSAWFTLDLGQTKNLRELRVALKSNLNYSLGIDIGDTLSNGKVAGGTSVSCESPNIGQNKPESLVLCPLPASSGRYVSVTSTNRANYRVYGAELWVEATAPGTTAPVAAFSTTTLAAPLSVGFDGSASSATDGFVTNWSWDFGDGNSATGVTTSHSYATAGTYTVRLTATDSNGLSSEQTETLTLDAAPTGGRAAATVEAAGGRASIAGNIVDELFDGSQNLASRWNSGSGGVANAWFTLDLGSSQDLSELKLAPRADAAHNFAIHVGDTLIDGQVNAPAAAQCETQASSSAAQPQGLSLCPVSASGRFVTVKSLNVANVRMYGAEVYTASGSGPGSGFSNSQPTAALTATPIADTLQVNFDASASVDTDGSVIDYEWDFGDGNGPINTASALISSTYPAEGTYTATVTVTDNEGATNSATQTFTVSTAPAGNDPQRLSLVVAAVGNNQSISGRSIDEQGNGTQNLSSHWNNGTTPVNQAWITFDLGTSHRVAELHLAPRGDRAYNLMIQIGDTLSAGQVMGGATAQCSFAGNEPRKPDALSVCDLSSAEGRYITVKSDNVAKLQLYGVEAWGS